MDSIKLEKANILKEEIDFLNETIYKLGGDVASYDIHIRAQYVDREKILKFLINEYKVTLKKKEKEFNEL